MNEISRLIKDNHTLMMILGCVAPMALLAAIFVFNVPLGTVGLFLVMLACPLMHVFMMKGMGHGEQHKGTSCHDETPSEESVSKANSKLPVPVAKKDPL